MKIKLVAILFTLSFLITSCTDTNPNKYALQDTWGANGDWGGAKSASIDSKDDEGVKKKTKTKNKSNIEVKISEKKKEAPKSPVKEVSSTKKVETTSNKPLYIVKTPVGWQKKVVGSKLYYVNSKETGDLNFAISTIKSLGESDLNSNFKDKYLKNIAKALPGFQVVSNEEESLNGKSVWSLSYKFGNQDNKIMQKQIFVPHSNNVILINFVATEDSFSSGKKDFSKIAESISFQ